ncbi:hypothetical protein M9979_16145 [Sphingomonas sp. RP10(2022)]|uniref:Uncharacterized protein n=1 Tax=Sphingomonas liriopis TaxID=2949094 RepID=A0A9X2HZD9_9SPHN|nr:hypothetical protein [Sphingomonas liriopis]MCP3736398.1 hypothetical protein [Sphingomonas liriopis]
MRFDATRALILYAGGLTLALGWAIVTGATAPPAARGIDTLDVRRINLRERDGTLRMVIAARDRFPGLVIRGREQPHPGRADAAGMLFYNDEGTENGGLIFGGRRTDGRATGFGHLSFDQYEQDQVVALEQNEDAAGRNAGLRIADRPDAPLDVAAIRRLDPLTPAAREAAVQRMKAAGTFGRDRAFFGKDRDGDALLNLQDGMGRVRLRLRVTRAGTARIEFLDAAGKVTRAEGA